ncbi:glycosyltransferase involved in cell wall biosynthesis [Actinoplanes octamycinicus]|uniref:Glycosyltransferase involved in cell wall biosynthesis n=1 Tax=Actinoplanes octamycinicus TaxID=135948 RepID=A0A7W7M8E7_9ACTN|nr:glycosyltransferase family 4 protein [Actinoplanes octamycinicus]MBB4740794.1 glycosyltransferase involved in cell wall biosynthesis [Actinoplanes octamycinicus]GIE61667.1 glycosyl transferase [Actinoplanes octamycinicus]
MSHPLHVVLPAGVDDPAAPSGGNRYDREVVDRLRAGAGSRSATSGVRESTAPGTWPRPAPADREQLSWVLAEIPDRATVLIDGLVACGVPEVLEPHAARLRLVILVHLPLSDETGLSAADAAELRALERRALHLAAGVIATSSQAAAHVAAMHDLTGVHVALPGVDRAEPATPSPTGHRLLCVASLTHRKGQDLLIRALAQLTDLSWECTLVGAGPIPAHPDTGNIRFTGALAGADLEAAYANADLFVLPSRAETYGMVITEALAHALPVVATEVGGVPEALGSAPSGVPGSLVPPEDPDHLAAVLRTWLTDPDLRDRWRARARARRETLTGWDDTARQLATILEDIEKGTA